MPVIRQPNTTAEPVYYTVDTIRENLNSKVVLIDSFKDLPQRAYIFPTDVDLNQMDPSDFWKIEYMEEGSINNIEVPESESNFIRFERPSRDRNPGDENEEVVFDLFQHMAQGLKYGNLVGGWKASPGSCKCTIIL